jgi:hypothetical protein
MGGGLCTVAGTTTPHGSASISGRHKSPARRHSSARQQGEEKSGHELRKEKGPVRVLLTRHPLYLPGEDAPARGSGRGLGPLPRLPFATRPILFYFFISIY